MRAEAFVLQHRAESLEEDTVDPMLVHPFKMPMYRLRMRRAIHLRRRAIRELQRRVETLIGIQFRNIRPEVDVALPRLVEAIMHPAEVRAVRRRREPALVAAHDLAEERGGIGGVELACEKQEEQKLSHESDDARGKADDNPACFITF